MTYVPAAIIGGLISMSGIAIGNAGIWKMMNAYDDSLSKKRTNEGVQMFSTGAEVDPVSPRSRRAEAGEWYRETYPDGRFSKMLRIGQVLTVAGFLVTFALLAI